MGIDPLSDRAVFLDRDGVLVRNVHYADDGEWEGPRRAADVTLTAGVGGALKRLRGAGYRLIVVSNQPNPAKQKASMDETEAAHARFVADLGAAGVVLDKVYYCYHHPQGSHPTLSGPCVCRKPSPFFLFDARDAFGLDLAACWMIGDRATDIECGSKAGVKTILVDPDHPAPAPVCLPDHRVADLTAAAGLILSVCAL